MSSTIAVVGASSDRRKFGNKCVRAYLAAGWDVFPIHPTETEVEGRPAYPTLAAVPVERLDRVSLYLAPPVLLKVLPGLTAKPVGEVWFNPGTESPDVLAKAAELGLTAVQDCSIVAIGHRPSEFPDV